MESSKRQPFRTTVEEEHAEQSFLRYKISQKTRIYNNSMLLTSILAQVISLAYAISIFYYRFVKLQYSVSVCYSQAQTA